MTINEAVTNLKVAKQIGDHPSGSPEWLQMRRGGIGGSQIGAILGVNKWESAYTAWAKAAGLIDDTLEPSLAMRAGTYLEPFIRDEFVAANPGVKVETTGTWAMSDAPHFRANPDGFIEYPNGELAILEIKYSRLPFYDGLPLSYQMQVLWYCFVTGVRRGVVAAFAGGDYKEFVVEYDEFLVSSMVAKVSAWWKCVCDKTEPAWDGSKSTYETVRAITTVGESDVELGQLWLTLFEAQTAFDKAEEDLNHAKSATIAQMSGSKTGLFQGVPVLTLSERKNGPIIVYKKGN